MADIAKHIIFSGRVQGVGFRYTAHRIALRCELTGFVKNLPNGSVEMLVQGHPDDVAECIGDIKESFGNYIRDTKITDPAVNPGYHNFTIAF